MTLTSTLISTPSSTSWSTIGRVSNSLGVKAEHHVSPRHHPLDLPYNNKNWICKFMQDRMDDRYLYAMWRYIKITLNSFYLSILITLTSIIYISPVHNVSCPCPLIFLLIVINISLTLVCSLLYDFLLLSLHVMPNNISFHSPLGTLKFSFQYFRTSLQVSNPYVTTDKMHWSYYILFIDRGKLLFITLCFQNQTNDVGGRYKENWIYSM